MKTLMLALFAVMTLGLGSSSAFARSNDLREGDYALKPLKGNLVDVRRLCPEGMICFTDGTVVELEFVLPGCMDRLGPVSHKIVENQSTGTVDIYVSAISVLNRNSDHTDCFRPNTESYHITSIMKFYKKDMIRLHYLGTND